MSFFNIKDVLYGTDGPDQISGSDENNIIYPGAGDDFIDGGRGFDEADFDNYTYGNVTIDLVAGTAHGPDSGNDTLANIESIRASGNSNITIIGTGGDNALYSGGAGINVISGGGGDDIVSDVFGTGSTLDGGSGRNALELGRSFEHHGIGNSFTLSTAPFTLTFTPGVGGTLADGTTYSNFEYLELGTGAGNDTVTFNQPELMRDMTAGIMVNSWDAGDGNDTVVVDLSTYTMSLTMAAPQILTSANTYTRIQSSGSHSDILLLSNVENYQVIGGSGDDSFSGGTGKDVFTGDGGGDRIDGGAGSDIARYGGLSTDYQVSRLSDTSVQVKDTRPGSPDGTDILSSVERLQWSNGSFTTLANSQPDLNTANVNAQRGRSLALSGLLSVSDVDGDAITQYQLWDSTSDSFSGYFVVDGVARAAGTVIDLTAAQFAQAYFVTGRIGDTLQIRASDGINWSAGDNAYWSPFAISVTNAAPVVSTGAVTAQHGQALPLSSLLSVSDSDGDGITGYQLWDSTRDPSSGYFVVDGVAQSPGTVINVTAAQVARTSFVTGKIGDALQVRATDGIDWSASDTAPWSPFTVSVPGYTLPVVNTGPIAATHGETLSLSGMFSVSDADGDAITKYQLWDSTRDSSSGHFIVNGVEQAPGTVIDISAAQLAQTSFVAGIVGDALQIRAFDGADWSAGNAAAWSPFTVTVPAYTSPMVTTRDISASVGQTLALSSLFSVSDADGDIITEYQLWDSTRDSSSGHFVVGGAVQAAGTVIDIPAAQSAQISFVTGAVGDALQIRAFDGHSWSAGDTASWAPFHIAT